MQRTLTISVSTVNKVVEKITGYQLEPFKPIRPLVIKKLVEYMEEGNGSKLHEQQEGDLSAFDIVNYVLVYEVEWIDENTIKFNFNEQKRFDDIDFNL